MPTTGWGMKQQEHGFADAVLAEVVAAFPLLRSLKLEASCVDLTLLLPLKASLTHLELGEKAFLGPAQAATLAQLSQLRHLSISQEVGSRTLLGGSRGPTDAHTFLFKLDTAQRGHRARRKFYHAASLWCYNR